MRALDRKLVRDLRQMRGQLITVALVVASGIAGFVAFRTTYDSLVESRDSYYSELRFADVFAELERAPEPVRRRLEEIPGVALVYTRVVEPIRLPLAGEIQAAVGVLVTIPAGGTEPLNAIGLVSGRRPEPGRADEAVLLASFAGRWGLGVGDTIPVVVAGVRRRFRVVGTAHTPEYIYPVPAGGGFADDTRFAVLWVDRRPAEALLASSGAFNSVALALEPGASTDAVIAGVDRVLEPYGGFGAIPRARQASNHIIAGEIEQLRGWATLVPAIFLGVAAFLLNVVLSRTVELQRGQIATLKAVGYTDLQVGRHFLGFVVAAGLAGSIVGVALGAWLGSALTDLYAYYFHLPRLTYGVSPAIALTAVAAAIAAGAVGALSAVARIVRLPPAEAMRPPAPSVYRPLLIDRLGLRNLVAQSWRMVLRELERKPVRTVLSITGIAVSTAIVVAGRFSYDSVDYLVRHQFELADRGDVQVAFTRAVPDRAVRELAHIPGVLAAEGMRAVPVRVQAAHRHRDVPLIGLDPGGRLRRVVDWRGEPVPMPRDGLLLTKTLAEVLAVQPGDSVEVRRMDSDRRRWRMPVAELVDEMTGLQAYLPVTQLYAALSESPTVTSAALSLDPVLAPEVHRRLATMPAVAAATSRDVSRARVEQESGSSMLVTTIFVTLFAATIAVGVVYNNARIALSMRSRELASLRVLGFTRAEISRILLGELGIQLLIAVPLGLLLGSWLAGVVMGSVDPERYRWPIIITDETYAFAATVVLLAGALSGLLVRRRLDHLDLIGVLKTRE